MKYLLLSFIIMSFQFSCENQMIREISDHGELLANSTATHNELSKKYLAEIQTYNIQKTDYANFVYDALQNHNSFMDSIIHLMEQDAIDLEDKKVSNKYMLEQGYANQIRQGINESVLAIEAFSEIDVPEKAKIILWEINDGMEETETDWASRKFKNMPFALSKTTLRQWQLNNSKACALILLDLREKMIKMNNVLN